MAMRAQSHVKDEEWHGPDGEAKVNHGRVIFLS